MPPACLLLLLPGSADPRGGQVPVPGHRRGLGLAGPGGGWVEEPRPSGEAAAAPGRGRGLGHRPPGLLLPRSAQGRGGGPGRGPGGGRPRRVPPAWLGPSEPGRAGQARVQPFPRAVPPSG